MQLGIFITSNDTNRYIYDKHYYFINCNNYIYSTSDFTLFYNYASFTILFSKAFYYCNY